MGIISETVEVIPSGKNIQYYKDLGYEAKWHQPLAVKVIDLPKGSSAELEVLCDMCHKNKMIVKYEVYNRVVEKTDSYVCRNCSYAKMAQTNEKRFGVPIASQSEAIKEKMKQTNLELYGVENYAQTKECHEKIKQTCLDKYHVEHPSQLQEIKDKKVKTNLERYGVENVFQFELFQEKQFNTLLERYGTKSVMNIPEAKEKAQQSNLARYGVPYSLQALEVREKIAKTFYQKSIQKCSKQQMYIHNLYNANNKDKAELNYPISHFNADICLLNEKIDIEVDFGGHDLQVKLGNLTQEEFEHKELIRDKVIKSEDYKVVRIKSKTDKLPSDQILLQMLSESRNYFQTTSHTWRIYDIDKSMLFDAENPKGLPYFFGELRKIKDSDIAIDGTSASDISTIA